MNADTRRCLANAAQCACAARISRNVFRGMSLAFLVLAVTMLATLEQGGVLGCIIGIVCSALLWRLSGIAWGDFMNFRQEWLKRADCWRVLHGEKQ